MGRCALIRQPLRVAGVAVVSWLHGGGGDRRGRRWPVAGLERDARGTAVAGSVRATSGALLGALIAAVLLSAVWIGALCLCGLASAFRSALWTMDTLR